MHLSIHCSDSLHQFSDCFFLCDIVSLRSPLFSFFFFYISIPYIPYKNAAYVLRMLLGIFCTQLHVCNLLFNVNLHMCKIRKTYKDLGICAEYAQHQIYIFCIYAKYVQNTSMQNVCILHTCIACACCICALCDLRICYMSIARILHIRTLF